MSDIASICETIRKDYSPCDVSDALLKLHVPSAGYLKDIAPISSRHGSANRLVAPISTIVFVPKDHQPGSSLPDLAVPAESNLPKDRHWTDLPPSGNVILMQQPSDQIVALVGDIVATRFKLRGVKGVFVDGRARDIVGCGELCKDGNLQVWSKALTSVGTSLEAKPWAFDIPLNISGVVVKSGDVLCADEAEKVACVIPREKMEDVMKLLPVQKEADDGLLKDVQEGMDFKSAIARWPKHYSNH